MLFDSYRLNISSFQDYIYGRKQTTTTYHPIQRQFFVRIVGPLGTFVSGCLIFAFTTDEDNGDSSKGSRLLFKETFQIIPTFISLTSSIMGILLAIYIVGKNL